MTNTQNRARTVFIIKIVISVIFCMFLILSGLVVFVLRYPPPCDPSLKTNKDVIWIYTANIDGKIYVNYSKGRYIKGKKRRKIKAFVYDNGVRRPLATPPDTGPMYSHNGKIILYQRKNEYEFNLHSKDKNEKWMRRKAFKEFKGKLIGIFSKKGKMHYAYLNKESNSDSIIKIVERDSENVKTIPLTSKLSKERYILFPINDGYFFFIIGDDQVDQACLDEYKISYMLVDENRASEVKDIQNDLVWFDVSESSGNIYMAGQVVPCSDNIMKSYNGLRVFKYDGKRIVELPRFHYEVCLRNREIYNIVSDGNKLYIFTPSTEHGKDIDIWELKGKRWIKNGKEETDILISIQAPSVNNIILIFIAFTILLTIYLNVRMIRNYRRQKRNTEQTG